jgi:cbb3-type cytochrome oxidase subunit 3
VGAGELGYLAFGGALVALFVAIIAHYYARGRRGKIEQAKYRMLDDDEHEQR